MKKLSSLFFAFLVAGALTLPVTAQTSVPAGNTGTNAGTSGGAGLGDTPSTAATGSPIGVTPVRPVTPSTGVPVQGTGTGDTSSGVTHSSGAGITDGTTRQTTGTTSSAPSSK